MDLLGYDDVMGGSPSGSAGVPPAQHWHSLTPLLHPGSTGNGPTIPLGPSPCGSRRQGDRAPYRRKTERHATGVHAGGTPALPEGASPVGLGGSLFFSGKLPVEPLSSLARSRKGENLVKKCRIPRVPRPESGPFLSRRAFIQAGAGSSLLGAAGAWMGGCGSAGKSSGGQWPVIDYGQSFIRDQEPTYQVDTGPIAFPDLSRRHERLPDALSLAFVAFNAPHFADFVIEDETPILQDDRELTRVHHYSRILSLPARNRIFAIEG